MLFTGLTRTDYDPKSMAIKDVDYMGSQKSILNKKSFYTVLSFGYSSKIVDKAIKGDVNLDGDVITKCCPEEYNFRILRIAGKVKLTSRLRIYLVSTTMYKLNDIVLWVF